jgi:two-component system sensor kinase FixL
MSQPPGDSRARRRRTPAPLIRSPRLDAGTAGEDAPRAAEARLEAILESLSEGVILLDERGAVAEASSAAARMFGYERAELIGVEASRLLPDAPIADARRPSRSEGRRKDGSVFPIELTIGEAPGPRGRQRFCVLRDLVERRESEARLEALQAQLVYAGRLTAMGELSAALAHEINQPFAAIATYVRTANWLLRNKPKQRDPQIEDILEKTNAQVMRAGEIIRRLREFVTRGDSAKTVESLGALVEEAETLALVGARHAGVAVTAETTPEKDLVLADRVQIQQVVVNLIRNAMEAMAGCPRRELVLSTKIEDGFARLDVADSGRGLDEATRATLFEPFKTTKSNGMGVGLSISRSIVEAHGGRIFAAENPGGGTIFSFTLPLAEPGAR